MTNPVSASKLHRFSRPNDPTSRQWLAEVGGERPAPPPSGVEVLNPRGRIPVSLIIDDSTCLVNLAHFCIAPFAEVFPQRYPQDWRSLPREIPDSFVRKFGEWCHAQGVKGKYSIVPYPACVGWVDREMPGWTRRELESSLDLVRDVMTPDWDIHPEMISHTWAIDTKTGRPYAERNDRFMENWRWTEGRSTDEIADYLRYALRILHNAGLYCEGITTPGGFGYGALPQLAQATLQSCREVYGAEIPHYFREVFTDDKSVAPRVEYAAGLEGNAPECVVSLVGCTGDWFGGWDGLSPGSVDAFLTEDGRGGRLPQVLERGEPTILVCHFPGIYYNGEEIGFRIFQEVVQRLHARNADLLWMKLSEIARYWAAGELTALARTSEGVRLQAPFACPGFTVRLAQSPPAPVLVTERNEIVALAEVATPDRLHPGTWARDGDGIALCFDLPRGVSSLRAAG